MLESSWPSSGALYSQEKRDRRSACFGRTRRYAATTGYGKGGAPAAGFSGKPATRSAEEFAEAGPEFAVSIGAALRRLAEME